MYCVPTWSLPPLIMYTLDNSTMPIGMVWLKLRSDGVNVHHCKSTPYVLQCLSYFFFRSPLPLGYTPRIEPWTCRAKRQAYCCLATPCPILAPPWLHRTPQLGHTTCTYTISPRLVVVLLPFLLSGLPPPPPSRSGTTGMTSRMRLFYAKAGSGGQTPGGIITHAYPYMHRNSSCLLGRY